MKPSHIFVTRVQPDIGGGNRVLINTERLNWAEPRMYKGKLATALWFPHNSILTVTETPDEIAAMLV